ncbi:hypothetical protein GCM10010260_73520 [Streptomyces filipinensis]|uniref:Uncharacterized protein n=1 Tax=Streptomyces filipinensis TaxID=66887 RepID=A0A918IIL6_9ACTN|nr:hypothetical protein GCM10010260_73520 [Streptomyces filipinensis]
MQVIDTPGDTVEIGVAVALKGDAKPEVPVAVAVECTFAVRAVHRARERAADADADSLL